VSSELYVGDRRYSLGPLRRGQVKLPRIDDRDGMDHLKEGRLGINRRLMSQRRGDSDRLGRPREPGSYRSVFGPAIQSIDTAVTVSIRA